MKLRPPRRPSRAARSAGSLLGALVVGWVLTLGSCEAFTPTASINTPVLDRIFSLPDWPSPGRVFAADLDGTADRETGRRVARAPEVRKRGGLGGAWDSLRKTAVFRRLDRVGGWVIGGVRLLWSIPKAVIQGDSRSLIEAIGALLSGAANAEEDPPADPDLPGVSELPLEREVPHVRTAGR